MLRISKVLSVTKKKHFKHIQVAFILTDRQVYFYLFEHFKSPGQLSTALPCSFLNHTHTDTHVCAYTYTPLYPFLGL